MYGIIILAVVFASLAIIIAFLVWVIDVFYMCKCLKKRSYASKGSFKTFKNLYTEAYERCAQVVVSINKNKFSGSSIVIKSYMISSVDDNSREARLTTIAEFSPYDIIFEDSNMWLSRMDFWKYYFWYNKQIRNHLKKEKKKTKIKDDSVWDKVAISLTDYTSSNRNHI